MASRIPRASKLAIRFARYGCANRPFYHVVVLNVINAQRATPIEQLGSYDPLPNEHNERLFSLNLERMKYWLAKDPQVSKPLLQTLGVAGYFPIHPRTYLRAWRNRFQEKERADKAAAEAEKVAAEAEKAAAEGGSVTDSKDPSLT